MKIKMDNQNKPLKRYPRRSEPAASELSLDVINKLGSSNGTLEETAAISRLFCRESFLSIFNIVVKYIWLDQTLTYDGIRKKRGGNGMFPDKAFSFFYTSMVGINPRILTGTGLFYSIVSYLKDFFPNFSDHDPFLEPEYFKYPYSHVTLDFLYVVYKHDNRIKMLEHAEENKMSIREFIDWVINYVNAENDESGKDIYLIRKDKEHLITSVFKNKEQ